MVYSVRVYIHLVYLKPLTPPASTPEHPLASPLLVVSKPRPCPCPGVNQVSGEVRMAVFHF